MPFTIVNPKHSKLVSDWLETPEAGMGILMLVYAIELGSWVGGGSVRNANTLGLIDHGCMAVIVAASAFSLLRLKPMGHAGFWPTIALLLALTEGILSQVVARRVNLVNCVIVAFALSLLLLLGYTYLRQKHNTQRPSI